MVAAKCSICDKKAVARGLCSTHYPVEVRRIRYKALKHLIIELDLFAEKHPQYSKWVKEITEEARDTYDEFKQAEQTVRDIIGDKLDKAAIRRMEDYLDTKDQDIKDLRRQLRDLLKTQPKLTVVKRK